MLGVSDDTLAQVTLLLTVPLRWLLRSKGLAQYAVSRCQQCQQCCHPAEVDAVVSLTQWGPCDVKHLSTQSHKWAHVISSTWAQSHTSGGHVMSSTWAHSLTSTQCHSMLLEYTSRVYEATTDATTHSVSLVHLHFKRGAYT